MYLDSQSSRNLHLLALGVGQKDNKGGVTGTLGDELAAVEAIEGRVWEVEVAEGEEGEARTYSVPTSLSVTVDLCAERDLGGMIGGGCQCQVAEMLHRHPRDRHEKFITFEQVLEWCSACVEPTLEEQYALAHHPLPGEELPQPCPAEGCHAYDASRSLEHRRVEYESERKLFDSLVKAAQYTRQQGTMPC